MRISETDVVLYTITFIEISGRKFYKMLKNVEGYTSAYITG